jgi:small subunit ribosomal protein S9
LEVTSLISRFNCITKVEGGGLTGQAEAIKLGIARALLQYDADLKPLLSKEKLLTRDPRMVERKKYGRKGARRRFQFSKR